MATTFEKPDSHNQIDANWIKLLIAFFFSKRHIRYQSITNIGKSETWMHSILSLETSIGFSFTLKEIFDLIISYKMDPVSNLIEYLEFFWKVLSRVYEMTGNDVFKLQKFYIIIFSKFWKAREHVCVVFVQISLPNYQLIPKRFYFNSRF